MKVGILTPSQVRIEQAEGISSSVAVKRRLCQLHGFWPSAVDERMKRVMERKYPWMKCSGTNTSGQKP